MKILPLLLSLLAICSLPVAVQAQSKEITTLMTQAKRSIAGGDRATAKVLLQRVMELDPNNIAAQRYLRTLELADRKTGTGGVLKAQIERLVVDKVDFKDASLDSVLQYLSHVAKQKSVNLSFVQKLPPDYAKTTKITLSLGSVPMSVVMQYVGSLSGTVLTPEEYAVSVVLASAQPVAADATAGQDTKIPGL